MTSKELIGLLYKIVYSQQPLSAVEQKALYEWRQQSVANEHSYLILTKEGGAPIRFREPHPLWIISLWCLFSLVLGACLTIFWDRQRQVAKHPYEAPLIDSAWHRIDRYARERGMVASYNKLGRLTFRIATENADLCKSPAFYQQELVDSMATQIYKDLIVSWNSYLGLVISTISIQYDHISDPESGFSDFVGTFNYSTSRIGDHYLRLKFDSVR